MPAVDGDPSESASTGDAGVHPRASRRLLWLLVTPIVIITCMGIVGDLLTTTLADTHPLTLTMLSSRNRILVLTTNRLDAVSYYLVAGARLLISDPLYYLLGYFYGDTAARWVERRSATYGRQLRWFERGFKKASYPLVFIAPNNLVCLFAGAAGMKLVAFFALNISGTFTRLYFIRRLGEAFEAPIDDVLDFFARYRLQLLALSVLAVGYTIISDRRSGKGELEAVLDLEHEIEQDEGPDR